MSANNPTRVEVKEVLDELEGHVRCTGNTIARDVSTTAEDGTPLIGFVVQHGGHQYSVIGEVGNPGVRLEYEYNLVESLAADRARADSREVDGELIEQAGEDLRDSISSGEHTEISLGLRDRIAEPPIAPSVLQADDFVYGFNLNLSFYPYHDMPSVSEFAERSQALVTTAWNGKVYLIKKYNAQDLVEDQSVDETEADLPPERGVQ